MNLTDSERKRLKELLLMAATSFENGISGVNISFLVDNQIGFAESQLLHETIAFAIRSWVADTFQED